MLTRVSIQLGNVTEFSPDFSTFFYIFLHFFYIFSTFFDQMWKSMMWKIVKMTPVELD